MSKYIVCLMVGSAVEEKLSMVMMERNVGFGGAV